MKQPVPVLIAIDHLHTGGAQEFLLQLCRRIPRDVVRISVCALRAGGVYGEWLDQLGIPVIALAPSAHPAWRAFAVAHLGRLLRSGRYALLHTLLEGSFTAGTPLSWLAGVPTMHSLMSIRRQVAGWYFPLMRLYQPMVGAYCSSVPAELIEAGIRPEKVSSVEVAIDLSDMLGVERDHRPILGVELGPDNLAVASIGRLFPGKGHELAIAAWPRVLQALPHARLLIVGDGEEEPRLRAQIAALGLEGRAILLGFRSDLAVILARTDILVRASQNEGVNLTTIQAMAAGLPPVGFANLVPKEIIVDGHNGLLVPPYNIDVLADTIIRLAGDTALYERLSASARSGVGGYYDVATIMGQYLHIYEALADGRGQQAITYLPMPEWPFARPALSSVARRQGLGEGQALPEQSPI